MSTSISKSLAIDANLKRVLEGIAQARAQRRAPDLARLLADAQRIAPESPWVALEQARQHLLSGDLSKAIESLRQLVADVPEFLDAWMALAHAYRVRGLLEDELHALNQALTLDASHPLILLQKAETLDLLGRKRAAVKIYGHALKTIPTHQQLPPTIEAQVNIAKRRVSEGASDLANHFDRHFNGSKLHSQEAKRFARGVERFLGKVPVYQPDPTLFLFPFLTNQEFYPRESFEWLDRLEQATADIREECINVLTTPEVGLEPYVAYPDGLPLNQWAELNRSRRWSACFLWKEGEEITVNTARCPKTKAVLESIDTRVDIAHRGPTAFFSILDANTTIPSHTGVTNTRLTVHLPLMVPPGGCVFRVGGESRFWQEGQAWVFDDSIEHEARNPTDLPRAILIFDVWHPELTQAERGLVRELMTTLNDYYQSEGVGVEWAL